MRRSKPRPNPRQPPEAAARACSSALRWIGLWMNVVACFAMACFSRSLSPCPVITITGASGLTYAFVPRTPSNMGVSSGFR